MAKDPKPENGRASGTSRGGSSASRPTGQRPAGKGGQVGKGRTRPPANVVTQQKPWGLIAAAVAVVVFAAAVITYAVVQVNQANADKVESIDEISGAESYEYEGGLHVATPVTYEQSPPVGGEHDPEWADCTGTVYDVDIRHENAVHGLEHGAVWITYNPDEVSGDDVETLAELVDGVNYRMMSPYEGLDSAVSIQSWGDQLKVDSVTDERLEQFADLMTQKTGDFPEPGATCQNDDFVTTPLVAGDASRAAAATATDAPVG